MGCTGVRMNVQMRMNMRPLGKKGVSGKVLTMVVSLVVAVAALIIVWLFLTDMMPLVTNVAENMVTGFKRMICKDMPWPVNEWCKWGLGA